MMSELDQSQSKIDDNNYTELNNEDLEFMIIVGFEKPKKNDPNNQAYIPKRVETLKSGRNRIMSNTDIDTLTVQLRRVLQQAGVGEEGGFETDEEEKYVTASDQSQSGRSESENPQDTENLKEPADLSPENSCADLKSRPGVRSNDDFRRVFKSFRFATKESETTYGPIVTLRAKKNASGTSPLYQHENEDLSTPSKLRFTRRFFPADSSKAHTVH